MLGVGTELDLDDALVSGFLDAFLEGQDHRGVFGTVDGVLIPTQVAQAAGSQRQTVTRAQAGHSGGPSEEKAASAQRNPTAVSEAAGAHAGSPTRTCLHSDEHQQPCSLCTEAPEDPASTELVGQGGRRNGNKLLRAKITRTKEWLDPDERRRVAMIAKNHGLESLARSLTEGRRADLCKEELIFLAKIWGFRSNIWRRRKSIMAGKGSGGAEADVAPEAAAAPAGRSYSPGHTQSTGGSVGNSAAIAPPLSSARQTSGEAQAEIFSPSAPTSVLAGPLPPLDRTAITADVDANTMVLCLQHNTMKRFQELGDSALEIHVSAGYKCGELIKVGHPCFVTDETSKNVATSIASAKIVNDIISRLHSYVHSNFLQMTAMGPSPPGPATQPRMLSERELMAEDTMAKGASNFAQLRHMVLGIQEQRRSRGEVVGEAQRVWEESYIHSYLQHREMLAGAARALEIARKECPGRDPYHTYLTICAWMLNFFLAYNHRLLAAHMVRKRWVDGVLESRRTAKLEAELFADLGEASSFDVESAALEAVAKGKDATRATTILFMNVVSGALPEYPLG